MYPIFKTSISRHYAETDIASVLEDGALGFGQNVTLFETLFAPYSDKKYNVATNSASAAAFIIFAYLKEKYGACDVYTPSIGFTSPAWAAKHHGHNLIFVEVDHNLLMDVDHYRTERRYRCERYSDGGIKPVVMPVLYGGVSNINGFVETIRKDGYDEFIIADSAQCATPTMETDVTFFSFHPQKPIAASDGGMISTDSKEIKAYAQKYRNFARVPHEDGYTIKEDGFKFYMNNLNATIAITQLETHEENRKIRKETYEYIKTLGFEGRLVPHDQNSSYYMATLIADTVEYGELMREKYCQSKLYPPLHKMDYYKSINDNLKRTEEIFDLLVNLPLYNIEIYK